MDSREIFVDQDNDGMADYRPMRRVWAAVLHRGVVDYCDTRAGRHDDHRDEECAVRTFKWIMSDDTETIGSFGWCCEFLGYDPDRHRKYIRENFQEISDVGQKGGRRSGGH